MNIKELFPDNIPERFRKYLPVEQREYLINGEIHDWKEMNQEVFSPICLRKGNGIERVRIGSYPMMTARESEMALDAALKAYNNGLGEWPTMGVEKRIEFILEFVRRMKEKREEVSALLMLEIGKSLKDSYKEFDRTVEYILDTVDALKELDRTASRFVISQGILAQIRRAPLGVVLCMGPYNYPLNETFTTLIPALIMGNTVIFKPPKNGVLLHRPFLKIFADVFPKGVVNTLYGDGKEIITPLMKSGKIDVLAFIGSSKVADILKKAHTRPHRLRCVLGLEAKNVAIVLKNTEMVNTVKESVLGSLSFNGQRCTALKIFFVHRDIAEEFLKLFSKEIKKLKVGMPYEEDVFITPFCELSQIEYFKSLTDDAIKHGAKIINENGGDSEATIFYPALLCPVNNKMRIYSEEQFGPVIPVVPYDDISEPIDYVVNSNYGQQLSIFGNDENEIARLVDPLVNQVCRVNINSQCQRGPDIFPFTGRKDSAEGTLSVSDALRVFSIRTLVAAKETEENKQIIRNILRKRKSSFLNTDYIL